MANSGNPNPISGEVQPSRRGPLTGMRDLVAEMRHLMSNQDDLMLEVGAVGELLVARIRLIVVLMIMMMPMLAWWNNAPLVEIVNGAVFASIALMFALLLLYLARRKAVSLPLRYGSAAFDITSISLVLALFLFQGYPHTAVNSRVVWELYLISIGATALRGDPKICMFAGGMAVVQYGAIIFGAISFGDLSDPRFAPFEYGYFSWADQISRLLLLVMATMLALAVVMRVCKLLALSSQDQMTGVGNRAYFDSRLEREAREAHLRKRPLCLAMLDVDRFKPFNDKHGHLAGDTVLRAVAAQLRDIVEPHGFVARYGGEEFAMVFPDHDLAAAARICEQVRKAVESARIPLPDGSGEVESPTVSIGLAQLQRGQRAETLLDFADRRLNRAKQSGRNQLIAAPS